MAIEEKYCDVCGHVLNLHKDNVYRVKGKNLFGNEVIHDATDCPYCGCQYELKLRYETTKESKPKEMSFQEMIEFEKTLHNVDRRLEKFLEGEPPKKRTDDGVMQTIYRKPRTGKTTELIRRCAENGGRIVCADAIRARCINEMAESMNFNILYPLTFDDLQTKKIPRARCKKSLHR